MFIEEHYSFISIFTIKVSNQIILALQASACKMFPRRYSERKYPSILYERIIEPFSGSFQQCDLAYTKQNRVHMQNFISCYMTKLGLKPKYFLSLLIVFLLLIFGRGVSRSFM